MTRAAKTRKTNLSTFRRIACLTREPLPNILLDAPSLVLGQPPPPSKEERAQHSPNIDMKCPADSSSHHCPSPSVVNGQIVQWQLCCIQHAPAVLNSLWAHPPPPRGAQKPEKESTPQLPPILTASLQYHILS
jgi:hypothetical protein